MQISKVQKKAAKIHCELLSTPYAHGDMMTYLTDFMKVINCCHDSVRPLQLYVKSQKQEHLESLVKPLGTMLKWARREEVQATVNEILHATYAKAKFYTALAERGPAAAILEWAPLPSVVAGSLELEWARPCSAAADCALTSLH